MSNKTKIFKLCLTALGILINIVAPFIAMSFKLPIYMDSIGTVLVAAILGARYGILTGVLGSLISGVTFDIYSLYYFPVQILTATMTSYVFKHEHLLKHTCLSGFLISFPTALASSLVTAFVFKGLTPSGSTYIIYGLAGMGLNLTLSCFIGQIFTEYCDKLLALIIAKNVIKKGGYHNGAL